MINTLADLVVLVCSNFSSFSTEYPPAIEAGIF